MRNWTKEEIDFVLDLHKKKETRFAIAEKFNKKWTVNKRSPSSIQHCINTYVNYDLSTFDEVQGVTQLHKVKVKNSVLARQQKSLIDHINFREDLLSELKETIKSVKFTKPVIVKPKLDKKKRNMTLEVMLSDLHYGKKTERFNYAKADQFMKKMADVTISEIARESTKFNVNRVVVALIGDIIENDKMHGMESVKSSEGPNSEQIVEAVKSMFNSYIVPLASTGLRIDVKAVGGNHDRDGKDKTFNSPGKEHFTWVIYKLLEELTKAAGIKNVTFEIPEGVYCVYSIYKDIILLEHSDFMKGYPSRDTFEKHIAKRSAQVNKLITYIRCGHWHEYMMFGRGRAIVNGSFPGQDSYAEINGYKSESLQVINYYIETENRPTSFYKSFPVYLEEVT